MLKKPGKLSYDHSVESYWSTYDRGKIISILQMRKIKYIYISQVLRDS